MNEERILSLLGIVAAIIVILIFTLGPAFSQQFLEHPRGCPRRAFCGCGAAVHLFGSPIKSLWPSTAWFRFPRSQPAPNTVAVRRGHVFVLKQHVEGKVWLVADYNSGGHRSRLHHRSISGYAIVSPRGQATSYAFSMKGRDE